MNSAHLKIIAIIAVVATVATTATTFSVRAQRDQLKEELASRTSELEKLKSLPAAKPEPATAPEPAPAVAIEEVSTEPVADTDRLEGLVVLLAQRDQTIAELKAQIEGAEAQRQAEEQARRDRRSRDRTNFMEDLKKNDPERYEQIREYRKNATTTVANNIGNQFEFLSSLNVEGLSEEQQSMHQELLTRLSSLSEAVSQLKEDPETGEMPRIGREFFRQFRDMGELMQNERDIVLYDTAQELGYQGDEAWEFVDYIGYVQEMTSPRGIMRGVGWGGRGGGGPGGGSR